MRAVPTVLLAGFLTLASGVVLAQNPAEPKVHPDELKLKPEIDKAIDRGVRFLIGQQLRDGTWGRFGNYDGGKTALVAYALLQSGVSADHPCVRRALLYIDRVKRPEQVYTIACMMLAYTATKNPKYDARLAELAKILASWQRGGDFGYPHHHGQNHGWSRPDLSNTQYTALGLWIAHKHKVPIPAAVWRRLVTATMKYQSKAETVKLPSQGKHTVTMSKSEIRGFGYGARGKPTGSMTTAGVAILQICKIGLGGKLGGVRRKVDDAIEKGMDWLGHHFRVDTNPHKNGWTYYYLYGLERVGSLLRQEQIGKHWWYVRGARQLLKWQDKDGGWRKGDGTHVEVKSAFALLFLRRATARAAVTGLSSDASTNITHVFNAGTPKNPVLIGGAGQQPLNLWVKDFGNAVKKKHEPNGLRVLQVEYLVNGRVLGQLAGDPIKPWNGRDAFLYRANALQRGTHSIKARVKLIKADVPLGETTATEVIESPVMKVQIRDVFADWMVAAAGIRHDNQVPAIERQVQASSAPKEAARVFDGNDATHWVCAKNDKAPEITLTTKKTVVARKILITQAGTRVSDVGHFDRIKTIEVFINKSKTPLRVELHPDQLGVTVFELPRTRKLRILRVRIVERVPGRDRGRAGFSEIGLTR